MVSFIVTKQETDFPGQLFDLLITIGIGRR